MEIFAFFMNFLELPVKVFHDKVDIIDSRYSLCKDATMKPVTDNILNCISKEGDNMVSGVSSNTYTSSTSKASETTEAVSTTSTEAVAENKTETAAVYEKSDATATDNQKDNSAIVAKLKADQESRLDSLKSLVEKMFTKQGETFKWANVNNEDIMNDSEFWNSIREGKFEVDEATVLQAQEDISEDGYWGVNQTSDRLLDFAKALTGGDASKIDLMRESIQKGFDEAKKLWGGELPELSRKTLDATMEKLDKWAAEATGETK